ncbi:serine/threonine protein phosphatase [Rhodoferax koreense]|uniref:Serine/threonine protein phosphatase n=1 Tax=Rhodoferax koreensis TaxID=1842727 RepID=A0A1P8K0E1_9BURK|nr:PP2C family serine/threonine-protein phosphatase [Rhodoferax koreense]APW39469.1 serine/threonine protein phosphatase [Rhodoferax koreense]
MKFSVFQVSRKGGRQKNEDRMGYCYTRQSGLFLLADGMGGHPQGEVAAQIALQAMTGLYQKRARPLLGDVPDFLNDAVLAAHHQILRHASERGMLDTPRTTIVGAVIQRGTATWAHCGDSRLYILRDGKLLTRTRDHSYLEQGEDHNLTRPDGVSRHVLFTCLGSPTRPLFDVSGPVKLRTGDKLLLCSDGLWGSLQEGDIVDQLGAAPVSQAIPELVEMALRNGGSHGDNVTAMAIEWETPDLQELMRGISTDSITDGEFASTIQSSNADVQVDDLDDAAIERSIAEINAAIQRSAQRKP